MKISSPIGFIPIIISGLTIISPSANALKYNDFNQSYVEINDQITKSHINAATESSYSELLLRVKFIDHLEKWKAKTRFLSSPNKIVEDKDFQAIIKLGQPAVKYIIDELKKEPSSLVWALNIIYGRKMSSNPNTTIKEASMKWVKFLRG